MTRNRLGRGFQLIPLQGSLRLAARGGIADPAGSQVDEPSLLVGARPLSAVVPGEMGRAD